MIRQKELKICEREQNRLGKYILQVPNTTTDIVVQLAAGLRPLKIVYYERIMKYYVRLTKSPPDSLLGRAFLTMTMLGRRTIYGRETQRIFDLVKWDRQAETIERCLEDYCIEYLNEQKHIFDKTCFALEEVTRQNYLKPIPHLAFNPENKEAHLWMFMDSGIGNRRPTEQNKKSTKFCKLCEQGGQKVRLN